MNIYVANLNFDIRDEDLRGIFTPYGEVSSAKVILDKETSRSRGFGFVEMADSAAGKKAIAGLDSKMFQDKALKVNEAKPREEKVYVSEGKNYNNPSSYNNTMY